MRRQFWHLALRRSLPAHHLIVGAMVLALVVGGLTTNALSSRPAAAAPEQSYTTRSLQTQSGTPRLEIFEIIQGVVSHKWSDDQGASWSSWASVGAPGSGLFFAGTPAAVSDGVERLTVVARDNRGVLYYTTGNAVSWSGWSPVPGTETGEVDFGGGCCTFFWIGFRSNPPDRYLFLSDPAVSSWGSGHLDLFVYAHGPNGTTLLHTWADNYTWSGTWEAVGTGEMQGKPAAVSWEPGRVDMFARGGANELSHKWYDHGQLFPTAGGWEDLGGTLASSPTVSSGGVGYFNIFGRNSSGGLSQRSLWPSGWGPWWDLDSNTISSAPAVAETPGYIHLFALDSSGVLASNHWTNQWWFGWSELTPPSSAAPAAATWVPFANPPPDTPTPTPGGPCGMPGQPPCVITP